MSFLDTLRSTFGCSGRCSGRCSLHDEHPPPARPLLRPFLPLPGGDSRCIAADMLQGSLEGGAS